MIMGQTSQKNRANVDKGKKHKGKLKKNKGIFLKSLDFNAKQRQWRPEVGCWGSAQSYGFKAFLDHLIHVFIRHEGQTR